MFDRFEADVHARALAEGGVPADDFRARFDEWLVSENEPGGKEISAEELEYRRALGVG